MSNYKRLLLEDFDIPSIELATTLLGKVLVRKEGKKVLKGQIVEVESYLGGEDKASTSFRGRRTSANEPTYMKPGTAFVYMTYGMYHCFNISSKEPGATVFLRALEPIEGIDYMKKNRLGNDELNYVGILNCFFFCINKLKRKSKELNDWDLCNGPSKLCISMSITKSECNKLDLCNSDSLWIEDSENEENFKIIRAPRIGIASAGEEWANKPLRFYILGNQCVSKKCKKAELDVAIENTEN